MNWAQVLFNSAVTGSLYLISAVALTLVYGLTRFPNFAHAELMALGAFVGYAVAEQFGWPFLLSFLFAFVITGIVSVICYWLVFKPLTARGASLIHMMVASLALGFILRHSIGQIWGFSPLSINVAWLNEGFDMGPLRVTPLWLILILTAATVGVVLHLVLVRTKIGKAIRATASNPKLALSSGINTTRVLVFTWAIGGGLAGIAGLFRGADTSLSPYLGWNILLPIFAVAVLGGIGSFYGAIVAALIIGLAENFGVVFLSSVGLSTDYRLAIPFIILIVVLIIRPQGLARLFKGN